MNSAMTTPAKLSPNNLKTLIAVAAGLALLFVFEATFDTFTMQIFKLCAINIILALSLNLINGFTGLFSLGHAGFMAIGAYTCAILTMSPEQKEVNYVLQPIVPWLANIHIGFVPGLIMATLVAGVIGWVLGVIALRLRDDYLAIAAEAMGINVFGMKVLSFSISSALAGLAGGLLAHYLTTIDPKQFIFLKTFDILLIVVLGGVGSITGSVVAAIVVTISMEALRFLDGPMNFGLFATNGIPGLRMVFFSALLMVVVIYRQQGLMGKAEFSWDGLSRIGLLPKRNKSAGEGK